jgi:tetratricopeptide (TPR) repeat protein
MLPEWGEESEAVSDEYPGEEPGTAAPTWAAVPTMPWGRVPEQRREEAGPEQWNDDSGRRPRGQQPPQGQQGQQGHPQRPQQGHPGQPGQHGQHSQQPRGGYDDPRSGYPSQQQHPDPRGQGRQPGGQGGRQQHGPDQGGHGRPAEPGSYGRPRSRALDEPTDEVPRVRRSARGTPPATGPARPSGRASVGAPPTSGGPAGRGPAVYGAPAEPGRGSNVYGGPPAAGREAPAYGNPANAPMSAPPGGGRDYGTPSNAPMSGPPTGGRDYGNAPMSAPPSGRDYGTPSNAPMSAPPGGREYGTPANAPMSAPPTDARDYGNAPRSAPPSGRDYGAPDNAPTTGGRGYGNPPNAPMSAPPSGRDYGTPSNAPMSAPPTGGRGYDLPAEAPMSAPPAAGVHGAPPAGHGPVGYEEAPYSSFGPAEDAPVSGIPVSAAPGGEAHGSTAAASQSPGIQVEFAEVADADQQPPVAASGMGAYRSAALTGAGVDGLQATGYLPIVRPGADGFPPELAAIAPTSPPAPKAEAAETAGPDPEQVLAAYVWRFDPDTLREQIEGEEVEELTEIRDLLTAKLNGVADNPTRARLLSLRAVVSRILNDMPKAFADGKLALAHAEATGELRRIAIAQARLAHVLQWREEFEEADRLFTLANSSELPDRLRATMHQHAGKCAYDQGRYMEACNHFERALDLRKEEDPELIAQTELALDAVFRRVAEKGWGPYPRTRDEILQIRKAPSPAFDEQTQRWGYIHPDGNFCIGPGYLDVQPFRDGVAWVQRQGAQNWELIDDSGRVLIEPSAGYVGVGSFSDGIAWVSRDGTTRWIAIDKTNAVLISTGYDDVRPFRRGVAAVRRGQHWGAVDGVGRVVVSFQYDGFATALLDGRYIDGFSDEGLAVISLDGRKGVVDRSGRVLVPPIHHTLMIHPVAFLIADDSQRWGALDRRGRTVIEATFPSRTGVTDEIDRLLADTRPVM